MLNIDFLSHHNALRRVAASQKLLFAISALLAVTISRNNEIALWTLLFMSSVIVFYAKIPWKSYAILMLAPLGFSLAGIVTIVISIAWNGPIPAHAVWDASLAQLSLYILPNDLSRALNIFLVAFSATGCLYFLILTTPIYEISPILLKGKVPVVIVELIELIYRFIFLFLQTYEQLYTAQQARLGYKSYKSSFSSLSLMISSLFKSMFLRYGTMTHAMKARNIEQFTIPQAFLKRRKWLPRLTLLFTMYFLLSAVLLVL
ncbi:cobalt ECF transporter T component CbiQ [Lysinibacillus sp. 54212]|uniref:cobalt ECF transporter T component CbiQ n=1 Tax=Lysinibacillus sp. 54212 TaxID=3119829 RepID=UPI002FCB6CAA